MPEGPIVLTAFEPFGAWESNSTAEVVAEAARRLRDLGRVVRTRVLPVDLAEAPVALEQALAGETAGALVCCGLSGAARVVQVERVALNIADFRILEPDGRRPHGQTLVPGAPEAFLSGVAVHRVVAALVERSIPAAVSNSAGTYLCNAVYFHALLATRPAGIPAVFLHLPPLPGAAAVARQTDPGAADPEAAMPLAAQIDAVVAVATALISGQAGA